MSKPKVLKLQDEITVIMHNFRDNKFLLAEAMLQIVHRENILTGNRIRRRHGEPEIVPEPVMYKPNGTHNPGRVEWVIDVPKHWVSETGKMRA